MFSYAFYTSLKHHFPLSIILIEPADCFLVHNGFELPEIFPNVGIKRSYKFYRGLQKSYSEYFTKGLFKKVTEDGPGEFYPEYSKRHFPFLVYEGYWQTEKYFHDQQHKIRKTYQFNETKLNDKSRSLSEILKIENSISIHVRRGDYLENDELGGICTLTYYQDAIKIMNSKVKDPIYYIFCDNKKWVNDNFSFFKYIKVDWNENNESWQDMFLMSKCRHNIIANSSFSWWGAWLNNNKDKIVVAPDKWVHSLGVRET